MGGAALLLRDFVNTFDVECGVDELGTPAGLAGWLREHGLLPGPAPVSADDLALALALREGLRAAMLGHHAPAINGSGRTGGSGAPVPTSAGSAGSSGSGGPAQDLPPKPPGPPPDLSPELPPELDRALARLPLRVSLSAPGPRLVPAGGGPTAGLGGLAAAVMACVADGTWPRLKACQERSCQWAFVDTSRNRSRAWCSMRVCGNRMKTRAYRARRRGTSAADL